MTDRERLIELLMNSEVFNDADGKADAKCLSDYLLANGVIVPNKEHIMFAKDDCLMLNMESKLLGKAIKQCVIRLTKGA